MVNTDIYIYTDYDYLDILLTCIRLNLIITLPNIMKKVMPAVAGDTPKTYELVNLRAR